MILFGVSAYRRTIRFLAFGPIVIGILVVFGWLYSYSPLLLVISGPNPMKFNTALCFIALGVSLYIRSGAKSVRSHRISSALGVAVAVFAIVNIFCNFLGCNTAIDQFFVKDLITPKDFCPGRMSPITLACLVMLGLGMAASNTVSKKLILISQYLFTTVTAITYIVFIGYLVKVPELYTLSLIIPVAINTALCLLMVSVGASLLNPFLGLAGMVTAAGTAGLIARRLTAQLFVLVLLSAYLRITTHRQSTFSTEFGIAMFAVLFTFLGLLLIWKTYKALGQIEEKNRIAEERFRTVVESAPNGMIIADKVGNIKMANKEAVRIFGYEREELLARCVEDLVPNQYRSSHSDLRQSYHKKPVEHAMGAGRDMYALTKSGLELPVEITLKPIVTDEGTMVLASIVDISERVKAEATMRAQVIELKARYQDLEQFNYLASHDLKEPLRTVSNYIRIIEEDYPGQVNDDIKEYHTAMNQAVSRMNTLVNLLLDYARLGYQKKLTLVDSAAVVKEVTADLNNLIKNSGAAVTAKGLPVLNAYETEFRLLLQNLINNAIKFSRKGIAPIIEVGGTYDGTSYEFYVKDNGIGIPPKHFEKIFNIFQRLHKESEYAGHGIGLTSCKKIVDMHGGRIWVESVVGQGTTFRFTIAQLNIVSTDEKAAKMRDADR